MERHEGAMERLEQVETDVVNNRREAALTPSVIIKWGTVIGVICTTLVSLVWFAGSVTSKLEGTTYRVGETEKRIEQVNQLSIARHESAEKDIDRVSVQVVAQNKELVEVRSKLDVAVAILERVEKKLDQTKP